MSPLIRFKSIKYNKIMIQTILNIENNKIFISNKYIVLLLSKRYNVSMRGEKHYKHYYCFFNEISEVVVNFNKYSFLAQDIVLSGINKNINSTQTMIYTKTEYYVIQ